MQFDDISSILVILYKLLIQHYNYTTILQQNIFYNYVSSCQ